MASPLGTILNRHGDHQKISAVIKPGNTVTPGLVYINGSSGLQNAPTNGSKDGHELFWYPDPTIVVGASDKSKKVVVYGLDGLQVIGKADGTIAVKAKCKPSTNTGGELITHTIRTDTIANNQSDNEQWVGVYEGHEAEIKEGLTPTNAADTEENCVFSMRSGN